MYLIFGVSTALCICTLLQS